MIDWQIGLLKFWESPMGKAYGREFMIDEAVKWGTVKEIIHVPDLLAHFMAIPLRSASPYYVTSEIGDLILQAAKLRNSMQYSLESHQLPTRTGFMVFEKQIYMKDIRGKFVGIGAMSWRCGMVSAAPDVGGIVDLDKHPAAPGVEIAFYTNTHAPGVMDLDTSLGDAIKEKREQYGEEYDVRFLTQFLLLSHKGLMFGQYDHTKTPEYADSLEVLLRTEDIELDDKLADSIYKGELTMTPELAEHLKSKEYFFPHDLFVAAVLVMNQRVAGISGQHADRSVMRRAQRAGMNIPNSINIITLRRLIDRGRIFPNEEDTSDPNWSHRWWVRGHWRRQYYPSRDTHEWIYVEPHLKGPEHLPVIAKPDVYFLEQ